MAKLAQPPSLACRWQVDIGDHVIALAWSADGAAVAAASISGPITVLDVATGSVKHQLAGHEFGTTALSWQPGGKLLASSGQDAKVRLWDASAGGEVAVLEGGSSWVERVAWDPRGQSLVSAAGKRLRLWNAAGELVRAFEEQPSTVSDVKWSARGKEFASAGYGGVALWAPDSDAPKSKLEWKGSVLAIAWSPDGKCLAGGAQDASVHFWYTRTGKDLEMSGYPQKVRELSWDSNGAFLATGGGNVVMVWKCSGKGPAGTTPISFELHEEPLSVLAFQNRGALLASACTGGVLALWLPGGSKRVLARTNLGQGVSQLAWSANDARMIVGGEAGMVALFTV